MTILIMIAQLLLGLSTLVILHEFGHYFFARLFKIRVEKFYLFFNPGLSLVRAKKVNNKWQVRFFAKNVNCNVRKKIDADGEPLTDEKGKPLYEKIPLEELASNDWRKYPDTTEWGIGWLPFGGFCSIAGMIDETKRANQLSSEPQSWEFRSKPAWQRLLVMLGGVTMNLLLGCLLFVFFTYHYERGYITNQDVSKDGIYVYETGKTLGFETGDKILSVNGNKIERFKDVERSGNYFGAEITIERNGKELDIQFPDTAYRLLQKGGRFFSSLNFPVIIDSIVPKTPAYRGGLQKGDHIININEKEISSFGLLEEELKKHVKETINVCAVRNQDTLYLAIQLDSLPILGFMNKTPYQPVHYTLWQSFQYGIGDAMDMLSVNIKGLGNVVKGKEKATESISGPIGIASIYGGIWSWPRFWLTTAILSLVLAFMNILPIPALDGGHALLLLIEIVTRRKPSDRLIESLQYAGMIILFAVMFFAIGNDIFKLLK